MNEEILQQSGVDKEKLMKLAKFLNDKDVGYFEAILEAVEYLKKMSENEKFKLPDVYKVEIAGAEILTIKGEKGDKGDKGDTPKVGIDFEQPKDGKDYILTEKDKKEIASKIQVPVVEKEIIIEKQPIITNEIKEVAKYEEPNQIVEKINRAENKIQREQIAGLNDELKRIESLPRGGGGGVAMSAAMAARMFKFIFHAETPTGAINGSNVTYTVKNNIWAILSIEVNGEVMPATDYSFINNKITLDNALPTDYASSDFIVKYIGF